MRTKTKTCFSHRSSAVSIGSNDDLLTEILLCLPVISICRFKCVSRHLRSLLSHPTFTLRYDTRHFDHKSPPGLFASTSKYFPFDDKDLTDPPLRNLDFFSGPKLIRILQSCNGLLLCCNNYGYEYYVFNPTTRQFVSIPSLPGGEAIRLMGLVFHQTDCAHFKVVCILKLNGKVVPDDEDEDEDGDDDDDDDDYDDYYDELLFQIQTYSSDTHEWKISIETFSARKPEYGSGVYWNGALHWAHVDQSYMYFKFDVEQLHSLPLPVGIMSSKTRSNYLGESRGHLHLIVHDQYEDILLPLKVYEMLTDHSRWFVKYHVELDEIQEFRSAYKCLTVIDVIRCEKDEGTFMVLRTNGLYIMYNVHDKICKPISMPRVTLISTSFHRYSQTLASF